MRILLAAVSMSVAAACLAPAALADQTRLDADAISGLFPGYYEAEVSGYTLLIAASTGGRLQGKAFGREDRGTWTIVGDQLCVAWNRWTDGEAKCGEITRKGAWYVAYNAAEGQLLRFTAIAASRFKTVVASASRTGRN
jgi:hypothetical protein